MQKYSGNFLLSYVLQYVEKQQLASHLRRGVSALSGKKKRSGCWEMNNILYSRFTQMPLGAFQYKLCRIVAAHYHSLSFLPLKIKVYLLEISYNPNDKQL